MPTAIVTGGAKRIGAAISRDLAENGFDVVLNYVHSSDAAEELAEELRGAGVRSAAVQADLSVSSQCFDLFAQAREQLGRIDIVVNNASVFEPDEVTGFDEAAWDRHFAIHLKAPSILAGELAKQDDLDDGLVVNMIDQRVLRLNPNFHSYTLSKSALWTATRTMAQALAPKIRVNAIGPGPTLQNARQEPEDFQAQIDGLMLKRGPELGEFGATIRHFWACKSITGQMLALDGGQHLAWETPDVAGIPE